MTTAPPPSASSVAPTRESLAGTSCSTSSKSFVENARFPIKGQIFISFSGGATSAYMTHMIKEWVKETCPWRRVITLFANTGQEHEATLEFVKRCDEEFGFGTVWVEAVVDRRHGKGIRHKRVDFETASRNGEPFEAVIAKYGIPNAASPSCTRDTKLAPMTSFLRSVRWRAGMYSTAVGIRVDEIDRVSFSKMKNCGYFYPFADAGITKEDVRQWWLKQKFRLNLPEHLGNCVWCWKKTNRKLLTIAKENPLYFDFPKRMEEIYPFAGPDRRVGADRPPRVFNRGNKRIVDILEESTRPFDPFIDGKFIPFDELMDVGGSCGDSCEIGADENDANDDFVL